MFFDRLKELVGAIIDPPIKGYICVRDSQGSPLVGVMQVEGKTILIKRDAPSETHRSEDLAFTSIVKEVEKSRRLDLY